jgi:MFS family permease
MAGLIGCVLLLVLATAEPPSPKPPPRKVLPLLWASLRRQGLAFWGFVMFAKFGETFGGVLTKPMLVDHGYTKEMIAWLDGLLGASAVIAGAALAGALVRRRGWAWTLARFSVVQGIALIGLGLASPGALPVEVFVPLNVLEAGAGGGVAVCVFALAMGRADASIGATGFTAMQVVYMAGAFLAAPAGGALGDAAGYLPVFCVSGAMAVVLGLVAPAAGRRFASGVPSEG